MGGRTPCTKSCGPSLGACLAKGGRLRPEGWAAAALGCVSSSGLGYSIAGAFNATNPWFAVSGAISSLGLIMTWLVVRRALPNARPTGL